MQAVKKIGDTPEPGQTLYRGKMALHVDKTFIGGEQPATYSMQAGARVLLKAGEASKPTVHVCECEPTALRFFYDDGSPLNRLEDTEHIPTAVRLRTGQWVNMQALAGEFVAAQTPPAPPEPVATTARAVRSAPKGRKGTAPPEPGGVLVKGGRLNVAAVLGEAGGTRPARATDPDD